MAVHRKCACSFSIFEVFVEADLRLALSNIGFVHDNIDAMRKLLFDGQKSYWQRECHWHRAVLPYCVQTKRNSYDESRRFGSK